MEHPKTKSDLLFEIITKEEELDDLLFFMIESKRIKELSKELQELKKELKKIE